MVLIIAILNDGTIMGTYHALVTVLFYWAVARTTFFESHFKVRSLKEDAEKISSAIYLQITIISQALIFVTRSHGLSFLERPGTLLICAFIVAQLVATLVSVYATIGFARSDGAGPVSHGCTAWCSTRHLTCSRSPSGTFLLAKHGTC